MYWIGTVSMVEIDFEFWKRRKEFEIRNWEVWGSKFDRMSDI